MSGQPDAGVLPERMLIGGQWRARASGGSYEHVNPATGQVQRSLPLAGSAEVDEAVASARAAFEVWRATPPTTRRKLLHGFSALIRANAEELAVVTALETGSPIATARTKVAGGAEWVEQAATWADKLEGTVIASGVGVHDYVTYEPLGVVGVIITWNGPIISFAMSGAAALATGCTVVLKPSELAPFSSLILGRLALEAGLPAGVLNVIPGDAVAGAALVAHPDVAKVSFTGGAVAGVAIAQACAAQLKPVLLELGGKSPSIVFADADLDMVVRAITERVVLSAGQSCICPTRLVVDREVHDDVVKRLAESFQAVRIGDPFDAETRMGPVIDQRARDRILGVINRGVERNEGVLVSGGQRVNGALADGFFIEPTLFDDVDPASSLAQDEIFGPVVTAFSFDDETEAVQLANDTPYGLAAYLYSRDIDRCLRVGGSLEVGSVGINGGRAPLGPAGSFGGVKASGYGRQGGRWGLLEFCYQRATSVLFASGTPKE